MKRLILSLTLLIALSHYSVISGIAHAQEEEVAEEEVSISEEEEDDKAKAKTTKKQLIFSRNHFVKLLSCNLTPAYIADKKVPRNVIKSNILRRDTGLVKYARGDKITIAGRILDRDCVPIQGARVFIWHADSKGKYVHRRNDNADKNFAGNGVTYTNNLGEYFFTTIMPGIPEGKEKPSVNYSITYNNGKKRLRTAMFFPTFENNIGIFKDQLTSKLILDTDTETVFQHDIILDSRATNRTY